MAFGKQESYEDDYIAYKESIDMLVSDLKYMGYKSITKEKLQHIFNGSFSIGRAVRMELIDILNKQG